MPGIRRPGAPLTGRTCRTGKRMESSDVRLWCVIRWDSATVLNTGHVLCSLLSAILGASAGCIVRLLSSGRTGVSVDEPLSQSLNSQPAFSVLESHQRFAGPGPVAVVVVLTNHQCRKWQQLLPPCLRVYPSMFHVKQRLKSHRNAIHHSDFRGARMSLLGTPPEGVVADVLRTRKILLYTVKGFGPQSGVQPQQSQRTLRGGRLMFHVKRKHLRTNPVLLVFGS